MSMLPRTGLIQSAAMLAAVFLGSMGADAKIIYVNTNIVTPGNGTTWVKAYKFLRDALDASAPLDQIWVAKGTYFPDDGASGLFGDRELSFDLSGVQIYGGFAGTETSLTQRNVTANLTTLSGEIWSPAEEVFWSLHVVVVKLSSTLDGVTVQGGNANTSLSWTHPRVPQDDQGGGCYVNVDQTLTLKTTRFTNNKAFETGGAIMVATTVANPNGKVVATDCTFDLNQVNSFHLTTSNCSGGAIKGNVTATNCKFTSNRVVSAPIDFQTTSTAEGGAISGAVTATKCDFTSNTVTSTGSTGNVSSSISIASGGAISGPVTAVKCTFISNDATATGPALIPISSGGAIRGAINAANCVFSANKSGLGLINTNGTGFGGGGALFVADPGGSLVNCVFVRNTSGVRGGAIHGGTTNDAASLVIANSTFLDNGVTTTFRGAALSCGGITRIMNNIFWNVAPTATTFDQANLIHVINGGVLRNTDLNNPTPASLAQNLVKGTGFSTITEETGGDRFLGVAAATIINTDPGFVAIGDPDGTDNVWRTADDGLRLNLQTSPAIGTARVSGITYRNFTPKDTLDIDEDGNLAELIQADLASFVRTQGTTAVPTAFLDMGAYEFGPLFHGADIQVERPANTILVDGAVAPIDLSLLAGVPTTFTIKNTQTLNLNSLVITGDGADIADFRFTQPVSTVVAPAGSTTFTVTFVPKAITTRNAAIHIASNDPDNENPFDINLRGTSQLPDVAVEQLPSGPTLVDGTSTVAYGSIGESSTLTKSFTIRNTGLGNLGIFGISATGGNAANFVVSAPGSTLLAPNATTTFTVTFKPAGIGSKTAPIVIDCSDPDAESLFSFTATGTGVGAPEILVKQPASAEIVDNSSISFGSVQTNLLHSKTIIIKNTGTDVLKMIDVDIAGSGKFKASALPASGLNPGAQMKFTLTFKPTSVGPLTAVMTIVSNDANESRIDVNLSGTGVNKSNTNKKAQSSLVSSGGNAQGDGVVSVTRGADGLKYLVLTVDKPANWGAAKHVVEVSPNLLDWFSGAKHTTTLLNNASTLQVRDDTPVTVGKKRYIRLK